jgi:sugar phosphate isomerase/epimerase
VTASRDGIVAACWTSAGNVAPLDTPELSPFAIEDRVTAVAAAGYVGMGLAQDDLAHINDTIGFARLRALCQDAGLAHVEVEILTDWWETGDKRARSDQTRSLLLDAAEALGAPIIKVGTAFGWSLESIDVLVEPLRQLAHEAGERGTRVAVEPMPFSMLATVPMAADLVRAVDHPGCGVMVDSWHVFRAGTTLDELRECLTGDIVVGVELDDADEEVVGTLFEDTIHRRRLCGEGSFDLTGLVQTLRDVGWQGPWGVEIISDEFRRLPLDIALGVAYDAQVHVLEAART